MAIFIPSPRGVGEAVGQGFEKGFPSGIQNIIDQKLKQLALSEQQKSMKPGLKYLYPEATDEELAGLSTLHPSIHKGALRGREAARSQVTGVQRAQALLQNLRDLEQEGDIDKGLGFFGGNKKDTYDIYGKELAQELKRIDPSFVVPSSKMNKEAREEATERIFQKLSKYGAPTPRGSQLSPAEEQQAQARQQQFGVERVPSGSAEQGSQEGFIGSILRNLLSSGANAAAPLAALGGKQLAARTGQAAAGPAGLIPAFSDFVGSLENAVPELGKYLAGKLPIPEESREKLQQTIEKQRPQEGEKLSQYLPTTGNIKKVIGKMLPDNFFEPRSQNEKDMQDLISKGVGLVGIGNMNVSDAVLGALGGTAARKVTEALTKGKDWGPLASTTADIVFTSMFPTIYGSTKDYFKGIAKDGFEKFESSNAAKTIDAESVRREAERVGSKAAEFPSVPSNQRLYKTMENVTDKFAGNKITVSQAEAAKKALDAVLEEVDLSRAGFDEVTGLRKMLSETIISEAKKAKLPFVSEYQRADQVWNGLKKGESIVDSLRDQIEKGEFRSITINSLLGKYSTGALTSIALKTVGIPLRVAGALGAGAHETLRAYQFLTKTPGAWEQMALAAKDAALGKAAQANARLSSLDKKALTFEQREEQKRKHRTGKGL